MKLLHIPLLSQVARDPARAAAIAQARIVAAEWMVQRGLETVDRRNHREFLRQVRELAEHQVQP